MSLRCGDYLGRMLRLFKGDIRFYGITIGRFGVGLIHWTKPAPSKARGGKE